MITSTYIFRNERHVARAVRRWASMSFEERCEAAKQSWIDPPEGFRAEEFLATATNFPGDFRFGVDGFVKIRRIDGEYSGTAACLINLMTDQELVEWISDMFRGTPSA